MPVNGNLLNLDPRTAADTGSARGALGKHQHLDVKDPAFGVHKWYYIREGSAAEELEAALRVADAGCGRGCEEAEEEVEGMH